MDLVPIQTQRLSIRIMRADDAPRLVSYRNDPEVARYQDWPLPYGRDEAERMLAEQAGIAQLVPSGWTQLAIDMDGEMIGDLAVGMMAEGRVAHVGYTLDPRHHGRGFATEALAGLVDALFAVTPIHRVVSTLDPENIASLRVLERVGFRFEGLARRAELIRGEWLDDLRYALLREDRDECMRRPAAPRRVELVELGPDNVGPYSRLATHRSQERFVAPMWASFRDALFPEVIDGAPVSPWMRGISADGEAAGFVMLADITDAHPDPYLWRLLIDRRHQRRGLGTAALAQVSELLRTRGCARLLTSWVEGPGGPRPFYEGLGFVTTGRIIDGEVEGELVLTRD